MSRKTSWLLWPNLLIGLVVLAIAAFLWMMGTNALLQMLLNRPISEATFSTAYQYWWYYGDDPLVAGALMKAASISALTITALVIGGLIFKLTYKKRSLYGDAKFATLSDINKAGLFGEKGILLGKRGSRYLVFGGQQHVLMDAPSRSGKGVGVVIPNLLNWPESVVVVDIKRENWDITSGFRHRHGQQCFLFDPLASDCRTHRWNPLGYVNSDNDAFAIDDIMRIGSMVWTETTGNQGFFEGLARNLFIGFAAMIRVTPILPFTLGECLRQSMKPNLSGYLKATIDQRNKAGDPLPPQVVEAFGAFCGTSPNVQGSILATYQQKLELFTNPLIDAATSDNDFDLRDVRRQKMSIYLATTPDNLQRIAPLINIFMQQLVNLNTQTLPDRDPSLKYQCLIVGDEFTALGKIPIFSKAVSYIAGYGLRLLTIVQSPAQLRATYGQDETETFITNHAARIVFAPKENSVAKDLSETLGTTTVTSRSHSKQKQAQGLAGLIGGGSTNDSPHSRALLLPQELRDMGRSKEIILLENVPPILAKKITYYNDKSFTNRKSLKPPSVPKVEFHTRRASPTSEHAFDTTTGEVIERAVKPEEVNRMAALEEQFTCDFSSIQIPTSGVSESDIDNLVDQFFGVMDSQAA